MTKVSNTPFAVAYLTPPEPISQTDCNIFPCIILLFCNIIRFFFAIFVTKFRYFQMLFVTFFQVFAKRTLAPVSFHEMILMNSPVPKRYANTKSNLDPISCCLVSSGCWRSAARDYRLALGFSFSKWLLSLLRRVIPPGSENFLFQAVNSSSQTEGRARIQPEFASEPF